MVVFYVFSEEGLNMSRPWKADCVAFISRAAYMPRNPDSRYRKPDLDVCDMMQIAILYKRGLSVNKIAKKLGRSGSGIRNALRRRGVYNRERDMYRKSS